MTADCIHRLNCVSRHADDTVCTHKLGPRGMVTEPGCTGRDHWHGTCACGWTWTCSTKTGLTCAHDTHRRDAARTGGGGNHA